MVNVNLIKIAITITWNNFCRDSCLTKLIEQILIKDTVQPYKKIRYNLTRRYGTTVQDDTVQPHKMIRYNRTRWHGTTVQDDKVQPYKMIRYNRTRWYGTTIQDWKSKKFFEFMSLLSKYLNFSANGWI